MRTLEDLRGSLSLTQKELADIFEVSEGTIYKLEKNSSNIKDSLLKKYLSFFNTNYDDIFLGNEYEKNVFMEKRKNKLIEKLNSQKTAV